MVKKKRKHATCSQCRFGHPDDMFVGDPIWCYAWNIPVLCNGKDTCPKARFRGNLVKDCPFCGNECFIESREGTAFAGNSYPITYFVIECPDCEVKMSVYPEQGLEPTSLQKLDLIARWNKRAR